MSKFYRLLTKNIGTTSFSITIVTHYRPVQNFVQMAFFHDKYNHTIIKIFRINLTEHLKDAFSTYIAHIKTFKHVVIEIWALKENCSRHWNVNIEMHFATWQMITLLCCVCYDEKQIENLFFWLLQNYNTFSKHKMLNLSFKTFFIHILAK